MANLKDLIVNGSIRIINTLYANNIKTNKIKIPTSDGGSTLGVGSNGQVVSSNGTTVFGKHYLKGG